jgi:hypothetical protein
MSVRQIGMLDGLVSTRCNKFVRSFITEQLSIFPSFLEKAKYLVKVTTGKPEAGSDAVLCSG